MKKFRFLLLIIALFSMVNAAPVDRTTATQVATNFWRTHTPTANSAGTPRITNLALSQGFNNFYIFSINEGQGFVIVAADSRVTPILAYSTTGSFQTEDIPVNTKEYLQNYENEIQYYIDNDYPESPIIASQWQDLLSPTRQLDGAVVVGPLLTTTWNQAPLYNNLCPYDNTYSDRTVVGCAATAMAQIMKYWNHPVHGVGSKTYTSSYGQLSANFANTTYDWANMPTALTSSSSATQISAVATLSYHCGVAIEMDYGVSSQGGSGAYTTGGDPSCEYALKTYFDYSSSISSASRSSYVDSAWNNLLRTELNAGRPILYRGSTSSGGGHAFVCDGYDNSNYFHYNWGWAGSYDGYFYSNALYPAGGGIGSNSSNSYNSNQAIVRNIEPNGSNLIVTPTTVTLTFNDTATITVRSRNADTSRWVATTSQPWITVYPSSGAGSGSFTNVQILPTQNLTSAARSGVVTITQGSQSVDVYVIQADATHSVSGTYGNQNTDYITPITTNDGILIRPEAYGNFAVGDTVKSIYFKTYTYSSAPYNTYTNNSFTIKIYKPTTYTGNITQGYSVTASQLLNNLVYTQNYTQTSVGLQEVALTTPFIIDTNNFWIELVCNGNTLLGFAEDVTAQNISLSSYPQRDSIHGYYLDHDSIYLRAAYNGAYTDTTYSYVDQYDNNYVFGFTISSYFAPSTVTIVANSNNAQQGRVTGGGVYNIGDTVTLLATPSNGYIFQRWQDSITTNPRTFIISANTQYPTYTAYFTIDSVTLTLFSNNSNYGSVFGAGRYPRGSRVQIIAATNKSYRFNKWNDNDTNSVRNITLNGNIVLTAQFATGNTIHDTTYLTNTIHDTTYLTNTIHDTTYLTNTIHDTTYLTNTIHDTTYVTTTIHDTVTISQPINYYTLQVLSANRNQGVGAGNGSFPMSCQVEIAAIPIEGYRFVRWNDGNTTNPRTITINGNASYTASFEASSSNSISNAEKIDYTVSTSNLAITITGAEQQRIRLFDNIGRLLAVEQNANMVKTFVVPTSGTYLIQVGNQPARKVVVIK